MTDKILSFCRREALTKPHDVVVCAVSGGADSVALLHLLCSLREELEIDLRAAHFNHCLRGAESDGDQRFVEDLCRKWNIPLTVGRGDPRSRAARTGESLEEACRKLRYDFLLGLPGTIAVAHHADDQLETVLLNLVRGTGLRGLAAMPPRQGRLIRPLLPVSRAEILRYLQAHGLSWREDHTNFEDDALRNRLRHHVCPLLYEENPSLAAAVTRMTGLLQQDDAYLQAQTDDLLNRASRDGGWDCACLRAAPPALRTRALRQLLPIPKPAMPHVALVEGLLQTDCGSAQVQLPGGLIARRTYGLLSFLQEEASPPFPEVSLRPGEAIRLPDGLRCTLRGPVALEELPDQRYQFAFRADCLPPDPILYVRPRRTGDLLQLSGGHKTVKRLMIDRKIPAHLRDALPVITDGSQLLAVCCLGADCTRCAKPGQPAWLLTIEREGAFHYD